MSAKPPKNKGSSRAKGGPKLSDPPTPAPSTPAPSTPAPSASTAPPSGSKWNAFLTWFKALDKGYKIALIALLGPLFAGCVAVFIAILNLYFAHSKPPTLPPDRVIEYEADVQFRSAAVDRIFDKYAELGLPWFTNVVETNYAGAKDPDFSVLMGEYAEKIRKPITTFISTNCPTLQDPNDEFNWLPGQMQVENTISNLLKTLPAMKAAGFPKEDVLKTGFGMVDQILIKTKTDWKTWGRSNLWETYMRKYAK